MYAGAKIFNVFTMESHWIHTLQKKKPQNKKLKKKKKKETKQDKKKPHTKTK